MVYYFSMRKVITKADIILAVVLLVLGLGSPFLLRSKKTDDALVVITREGEDIGSYSLSEDRVIAVTENGIKDLANTVHILPEKEKEIGEVLNLIVIEDGSVRVTEATCKGQDCVKMGAIDREGEVIACLPHKLLISITSGGDSPDVIIR